MNFAHPTNIWTKIHPSRSRLAVLVLSTLILSLVVASCSLQPPQETSPSPTEGPATQTSIPPTATLVPTATPQVLAVPYPVRFDPTIPNYFVDSTLLSDLVTAAPSTAGPHLLISAEGDQEIGSWTFLAVLPFYSHMDGISSADLRSCWIDGQSQDLPFKQILIATTHLESIEYFWGPHAEDCVRPITENELTDMLWIESDSLALLPFENLVPDLKVAAIDQIDPLSRQSDMADYPLSFKLYYQIPAGIQLQHSLNIPATNFDPDKLTVVALTGVTALVRDTAKIMEDQGVTYPAGDIKDILTSADITHISNEVPFAADCPAPDASQVSLQFCSDDRYLQLLEEVGTDIVELSGDHFGDWGSDAVLHTIDLYENKGWAVYGGGRNLADGLAPVLISDHGNQFAFIGCNGKGIAKYASATAEDPGASQCDFPWMISEITRLTEAGYLVIATMQHEEVDSFWPIALQHFDFRRLAEAGAVIVSGSQAHHPQGFEFSGSSFIHYGLGNLFFDQWYLSQYNPKLHINKDKAFIDLHYFYQGRHINTRLIPIQFIDNARPRPMTAEESVIFFDKIYQASRWNENWIYLYSSGIISDRME